MKPLNELQLDDLWQRGVFDKLLAPVLRDAAYKNQIVFLDIANPVADMLQRRAHIDAMAQLKSGTLSIEIKLVRYPQGYGGHWSHFFLETWSCSQPGHESKGWMATSMADVLLWGQVSKDEHFVVCWPLPFNSLRAWTRQHWKDLPERRVENRINGYALWTIGRLAPIKPLCRDLRIEAFKVNDDGLICDLFGKPILAFLQEGK
jgi:hypothetical protein